MTTKLVGTLPADAEVETLDRIFSRYGEVEHIELVRDEISRRARSYGLVDMPKHEEARRAIRHLDRQLVRGAVLNGRSAIQGQAETTASAATN